MFADHPTKETSEQDVRFPTAAGKGLTVFVWDMDETLIIFQTLLDGRYVGLFDGYKDCQKATHLGRRWEQLILEVCDEYFFYQQVLSSHIVYLFIYLFLLVLELPAGVLF